MTDAYNSYYGRQLEDAQIYQDWVMAHLMKHGIVIQIYGSKQYQHAKGESISGDEIKFDKRMKDTGNLYIETFEKSHPQNTWYVESGVLREGIRRWIHGDYDEIYVFEVSALRKILFGALKYREVKTQTSKGLLLPKADADALCTYKFRVKDRTLLHDITDIVRPDVMRYKDALTEGRKRSEKGLSDF